MRKILYLAIILSLLGMSAFSVHAQTPTLKRAYSYVGLSGNNSDTANYFTINLDASGSPRAAVTGDLVLFTIAYPSGDTLSSVTSSVSSTWTVAKSCTDGGTARTFVTYYTLAAGTITSITATFSGQVTNIQVGAYVFNNVATSSPIDGSGICTKVTPANNTAPNISTGNFTTGTNGDLIFNQVWNDASGTIGFLGHPLSATTPVTFGSGMTGLYSEVGYGAAAQYEVQATASASTNIGITMSQATHDAWETMAIAILAGSGGSAAGTGTSIVHSQFCYIVSVSETIAVPFPSSGNLIVVINEAGTAGASLAAPTDSSSSTYTEIASTPSLYPQTYWAGNVTTGSSLVVTLHTTTASGNDLISMYDVANAAMSPLDTTASAANSSTLTATGSGGTKNIGSESSTTVSDASSIAPSTATGVLFDAVQNGNGPMITCTGSPACTYDYITAGWCASTCGDNNGFTNGDGMAHYYPSGTSGFSFQFTVVNNSSSWASIASSFLAGAASSTPGAVGVGGKAGMGGNAGLGD